MMRLDELLTELADALPTGAMDPVSHEGLGVSAVELTLPVESQIHQGANLALSLPRGRMATGFDVAHGRLHVNFVRGEP